MLAGGTYKIVFESMRQVRVGNESRRRAVRRRGPPAALPASGLPDGWAEKTDPTSGRKYYVNHEKMVTQWERPRAQEERRRREEVQLVPCPAGDPVFGLADSLLQNTWFKKDKYELVGIIAVHRVENPRLASTYDAYKASVSRGVTPAGRAVVNGNETQVFHGCTEAAMDVANPNSIVRTGFLKKYWKTSAGDWQRFGPGFYFGQQASKSHEYPLPEMQRVGRGEHTRKMLLCKVARGKIFKTAKNLDTLKGAAPEGFDSVHGDAQKGGALNYDELVVYREEAVLPFAVVEYRYIKH